MNRFRYAILISALVIPGATQASSLFTYHGLVSEKSKNVTINFGGNSMTVGAGIARVSLDGSPQFHGMCVDLSHFNTSGSSYQVDVKPITDRGATAARAAWIFHTYGSTVDTKEKGAALQLAIWDVIYDGGNGLAAGTVQSSVTGSVLTHTNSYLAGSVGMDYTAAYYFKAVTHGPNNDKNQDYMGLVPEPATMSALLLGSLAMLRRRKKSA